LSAVPGSKRMKNALRQYSDSLETTHWTWTMWNPDLLFAIFVHALIHALNAGAV
jgi:hypothetical protein